MSGNASARQNVERVVSVALLRSTLTPFSRLLWRPRLIGGEHFPRKGPCFLYGNHSNRFDPFVLNCFTRWSAPTAGVMTREYFRGRLLSTVFGAVGVVPASKRLAEPHLIRQVLRLLESGAIVVIFPEGGARWDGTPMPWMSATLKLFVRARVPVHPVRIHGSYLSWPRWADFPRPARITVEALPALHFDRRDPVHASAARLKDATLFDENVDPLAESPPTAFRPAAGIQRLLYRDPWDDSGPLASRDGYHVQNRAGTRRFRMSKSGRLHDQQSGTEYSGAELYRRIRRMPLDVTPAGAIVRSRVMVHEELSFPNLVPVGRCSATLHPEHIEIRGPSCERNVDLDQILYCDIERNYKLQFYLKGGTGRTIQFSFDAEGSALQWKDAVDRLHPELARIDESSQRDPDIR